MAELPSIIANEMNLLLYSHYTWQIRQLLLIIQLLVCIVKSIIANYNKRNSSSVILGNSAVY